ncbi:hypothetical protein GEMRC1_006297 [Eukaryota sp. GEM-RC1]
MLVERCCSTGGEAVEIISKSLPWNVEGVRLPAELFEKCIISLVDSSVSAQHVDYINAAADLLDTWTNDLFAVSSIKSNVSRRVKNCADVTVINGLKKLLARIYLREGNINKAVVLLIHLQDPMVIDLVKKHHAITSMNEHVITHLNELFLIDKVSIIELLVKATKCKNITVAEVINRLEVNEYALFCYLHGLFKSDGGVSIAKDFHSMQLELYAKFDSSHLLPFLKQSSFYPLNKALEVCEEYELHRELVFVLGRMGSSKEHCR